MSKLQVFAVLDKAVGAFLPPMFFRSVGEATRVFSSAAESPDHQFSKHSDDYILYHLGQWDDTDGLFATLAEPKRLFNAREIRTDAKAAGSG